MGWVRHLWYPVLVVLAIWSWVWLDAAMGWQGPRVPWLGGLFLLAGGLLAGWCTWLLGREGRGTPHPFAAKTKRLVTGGPYAVVRNPMMYAVGAILAGLALWRGSVGLWLCLVCFIVYIRWFIRAYEERDMERRFGDEYREYCRRVPRWRPRRRGSG